MTKSTTVHNDLLSTHYYFRLDILDIFGISDVTLQRLEARREGPPKTILPGRRVAYRKTSFEEWLASREQMPRPIRVRRTGGAR